MGSLSTLIGCTALANGDAAGDDGIAAANQCTIVDCNSSFNAEDGIQVGTKSYVAGNDTGPIGTAALATSPWANIAF